MFSFNSLHKGGHKTSGTLRRSFARSAFVLIILSALLVFSGCDDKPPPPPPPPGFELKSALIGTWSSTGGDSYTITATKLSYDAGGYGGDYAGTIRDGSNFTDTAGVIIIEYDLGHECVYYNSGTVGPGTFLGIYYKELTPGVSVEMGQAMDSGYTGAEEKTLADAKVMFTAGNEGTYMSFYGTYTK